MEKPTLEVVIQALDTLYRAEEVDHKAKANEWLTQLTQSVHAWEVADQLLLLRRDVETSHFAAQTMQSKIRYAFHELPANTHTALRDSLLNHLTSLCEAPSIIIRQLAMALADLALLMGTWNTVVDDLVKRFSGNLSTVRVLLDVLIILPEEINNRYLHLGQNRRKQLTALLSQSSAQVTGLLSVCLTSCPGDVEIMTRVFACLGSWAQLRGITRDMLVSGPLLDTMFDKLELDLNEKLYDALTDAVCSLLFMCEDVDQYPLLSVDLKTRVKGLLPVFKAAIQCEDMDRAYCLCRIFTELAESYLFYIIQQPGTEMGDPAMLDLLLESAEYPDYEVVEITFNVWFRLGEELLRLNDPELCDLFKPYVQRLVSALTVHCQLDQDMAQTEVPDDKDNGDFIGFRDNVVELIRDTVFVYGSLNCFAELYSIICKPGTVWNVTEACLFVMHAVAPSIRHDESEVLPIAVPVLLSIPASTHYAIRATTLRLVSGLAIWINKHPDTLDVVLQFILSSLQMPPVANEAANAVQSVCDKCRSRMGQHFQGLVQIIEAADNLGIKNECIVGLLKGATEVLSEMDLSAVGQGLLSLVSLIVKPASQEGSKMDVCVCVDRLSAVFRACSLKVPDGQDHPAKQAMAAVWPVLSQLINTHQHQPKVIERTCRCIRFMLRCSSTAAADLLQDIATTAVTVYRSHHHSCFLYLGSIIVDEYGGNPAFNEGLSNMLQVFAEVSLPLLAGPSGLIEHPDTIDDLFRLCARYLQRCPVLFLNSSVSSTMTQCALACCTLSHRDAFTSVMKYFRDLLHLPQQLEYMSDLERGVCVSTVQSFITEQGQLLVDGLVSGFVNLRAYMTTESTEVLWEMLLCAREHTCHLLKTAVTKLPETSRAQITEQQQTEFVTSVASCSKLDDFYPIIKTLTRLYR